jgi:hypothetical protein
MVFRKIGASVEGLFDGALSADIIGVCIDEAPRDGVG